MIERLGKYQIEAQIGRGGMGAVYRARDPLLKRQVALKVISENIDVSDELRAQFFREAQACAQLSHPNIITIYELGEDEGRLFIVMEYLEGEELKQIITQRRHLPLENKLTLMMQVCDGLAYAHDKGIVHRDVKPGNVFVLRSGTAKILDFGVARLASASDDLTRAGFIMGMLRYMPPEQVRGRVDQRSDMFSAGAVFYELMAYRAPLTADDPMAILEELNSSAAPSIFSPTPPSPRTWRRCSSAPSERIPTSAFGIWPRCGKPWRRFACDWPGRPPACAGVSRRAWPRRGSFKASSSSRWAARWPWNPRRCLVNGLRWRPWRPPCATARRISRDFRRGSCEPVRCVPNTSGRKGRCASGNGMWRPKPSSPSWDRCPSTPAPRRSWRGRAPRFSRPPRRGGANGRPPSAPSSSCRSCETAPPPPRRWRIRKGPGAPRRPVARRASPRSTTRTSPCARELFDTAAEQYRTAAEALDRRVQQLLGDARRRLEQRQFEECLPLVNEILALIPDHPEAAVLRREAHDGVRAEAERRAAFEQRCDAARRALAAGHLQEAIDALTTLVEEDADHARARQLLAGARAQLAAEQARAERIRAEEDARAQRLLAEAEARRAEEEVRARLAAEEARAQRLLAEAQARQAAEEARALLAAEEEARAQRLRAEAQARQADDEARTRLAAEQMRARLAEEEARARLAQEEARAASALPEREPPASSLDQTVLVPADEATVFAPRGLEEPRTTTLGADGERGAHHERGGGAPARRTGLVRARAGARGATVKIRAMSSSRGPADSGAALYCWPPGAS